MDELEDLCVNVSEVAFKPILAGPGLTLAKPAILLVRMATSSGAVHSCSLTVHAAIRLQEELSRMLRSQNLFE